MTIDDITFFLNDSSLRDLVHAAVDEHGCALIADLYNALELEVIRESAEQLESVVVRDQPDFYAESAVWAIKSAFDLSPELMRLTLTPALASLLTATVDDEPLRLHAATAMGKRGGEPEPVEWHQDNGIPVDRDLHDERRKGVREGGVPYRYGTKDVLDHAIECRVHVDPQRQDGGCLQVVPGSHHWEVTDYDGVAERIGDRPPLACVAPAGSALIFRPLLAHMSHRVTVPLPAGDSRRVIQVQFHAESVRPEKGLNFYPWQQSARLSPGGVVFEEVESSQA